MWLKSPSDDSFCLYLLRVAEVKTKHLTPRQRVFAEMVSLFVFRGWPGLFSSEIMKWCFSEVSEFTSSGRQELIRLPKHPLERRIKGSSARRCVQLGGEHLLLLSAPVEHLKAVLTSNEDEATTLV